MAHVLSIGRMGQALRVAVDADDFLDRVVPPRQT